MYPNLLNTPGLSSFAHAIDRERQQQLAKWGDQKHPDGTGLHYLKAGAKERLNIPGVIVICGSTRFMQEMADADRELTFAGHIVVKPGCNMKEPHPLWADEQVAERGKARLDALHRAKIRLADRVLVVGDYIGDSTRAEIAYARSLGKPVDFTHPGIDPATTPAP